MALLPCAALAALLLVAAVPNHVLTSAYFGGYSGTHKVSPTQAARVLSWAEVNSQGAAALSPLGVKTMLYSNPNRLQPRDQMYGSDEDEYAHTCAGDRARGESAYPSEIMTNPGSQALASKWRFYFDRHAEFGHFDAIFADDAVGAAYGQDEPCNYTFDAWLASEKQLFRGFPYPIVYNGLNDFYRQGVAREIALNSVAAGGMMEECYAQLRQDHRVGGWRWWATEETELRMAREHKKFFCYGRDLTPADQSYSERLFTYASFLLSYDLNTTVLWEYYKTPSDLQVMPESALVALDPARRITRVAQLYEKSGPYVREYKNCYIGGSHVGPCAAAVNPDTQARPLLLPGYHRTLRLDGAGILDGGTARIVNVPPPATLQPLRAVIAFK